MLRLPEVFHHMYKMQFQDDAQQFLNKKMLPFQAASQKKKGKLINFYSNVISLGNTRSKSCRKGLNSSTVCIDVCPDLTVSHITFIFC